MGQGVPRGSLPSLPGIDVQQVTTVVNFGLPVDQDGEPDFETYLHRIGRAGRFGHRGIAFSVVEREAVELVHKIEEYFREYPHGSAALGGTVGTVIPLQLISYSQMDLVGLLPSPGLISLGTDNRCSF